jgi:serine protease Do
LTFLFSSLSTSFGQERSPYSKLPRSRYRSGAETLRAFAPVSESTRHSIVKLNVNGETVALGTVMNANGLVLTKASELKPGKLTSWLATDKEVDCQLLCVDDTEDLALVRVNTHDVTPIQWASEDVAEGQWAVTPGIGPAPHAVGVISAKARRIRPERAFIGVQFDAGNGSTKVSDILPGLGAEKAGLKPGDFIMAVNRNAVTNREQVINKIRDMRAGQTVHLMVLREATPFEVDIQLMVPTSDSFDSSDPESRRRKRVNGQISHRAEGFDKAIEHDTVLAPWLCGGPLVNLDGKAIGLNIARASRVTTFALPPKLVLRIFEDLKAKCAQAPSKP